MSVVRVEWEHGSNGLLGNMFSADCIDERGEGRNMRIRVKGVLVRRVKEDGIMKETELSKVEEELALRGRGTGRGVMGSTRLKAYEQ